MNPSIKTEDDLLLFKFTYNQDFISRAKLLGMRWSPTRRVWYAKITRMFINDFFKIFPEVICPPEFSSQISTSPDYSDYSPSDYLLRHQHDSAVLATNRPRYCFFHGIGSGKTLLGIELVKQKGVKTLAVTPLSVIEDAWMADLRDFAPEINVVDLWTLKRKGRNWTRGLDKIQLGVINFDSFRIAAEELKKVGFNQLLIDESARLKDARAKTTQVLIEFAENMDFCYLFSGNPAPNNELEYFNQARAVDPTKFGRSFYKFRAKYFYSCGYGGYKWKMKEDMREEFLNKLAEISEVIRTEDITDLPPFTNNIRKVYLDITERKLYEDMRKKMYIELGGQEVLAVNAAVKIMKLREGTSGFYYDDDKKAIIAGRSKFNELEQLLEEIGDHQVLIWTHFHYEADEVQKLLDGKTWGRADGTIVSRAKKDETIKAFKKGDLQYLIAHPGSIRHGIRLENCTYAIFFSLSHSYEFFDQCCGRIWRKGQTKKCSFYFLIADRSVDEVIMKALENKGKVVEEVFRYIKEGK